MKKEDPKKLCQFLVDVLQILAIHDHPKFGHGEKADDCPTSAVDESHEPGQLGQLVRCSPTKPQGLGQRGLVGSRGRP